MRAASSTRSLSHGAPTRHADEPHKLEAAAYEKDEQRVPSAGQTSGVTLIELEKVAASASLDADAARPALDKHPSLIEWRHNPRNVLIRAVRGAR